MNITKESKNLGSQEFTCECGTEFVAERGEYTQTIGKDSEDLGWERGIFGLRTSISLSKKTPCFILAIACPSCGSKLEKFIPTGEKSHIERTDCGW